MVNPLLLYIGSSIVILWGLAHLFPTRNVVKGFGNISMDNKRIITMEWIMEGVTFLFIGILVILVSSLGDPNSGIAMIAYLSSAAALVVMAAVSAFTGARVKMLPFKLCPFVLTAVAVLFILGSKL